MFDYKTIATNEIAEHLRLRQGKYGNYHCFNPSAHNNNDTHASLSISKKSKGFKCQKCGLKGNNVELVKQVLKVNTQEAIRWISGKFNNSMPIVKINVDKNREEKVKKYQIRFIKKGLAKDERFLFMTEPDLVLKEPTQQDIDNLKSELGKSYSLETLQKANIKINHSKGKYGLVFPKGQLIHNPNKFDNYMHVEGRTDYLTALELALDGFYGIVSDFNKTAKISLSGGHHYFILDRDVSEERIKDRLNILSTSYVKLIRLPSEFDDLSDYFNKGNCTKTDILNLIEKTELMTLVPNSNSQQQPPKKQFKIYTARDLFEMEFPEPRWAIRDILPEGLTILAGRPKSGKSWMALGLSVAVTKGGVALGRYQALEGEALFIGLEDKLNRLRDRLEMMLNSEPIFSIPEGLHLMNEFSRLDDDGYDQLSTILENKPNIRLVVIDIYQRIAPSQNSNKDSYAEDYRNYSRLQEIAFMHRVAIILIHHTRKTESENALDEVLGSTAITGAADCIYILKQKKHEYVLHITGRDIEERELAVKFEPKSGLWNVLGDSEKVFISDERKEIINIINNTDSPLSPKRVSEITGKPHNNIKQLLFNMHTDKQLYRTDRGEYYI